MAKRLHGAGFSPIVRHRDLASPPSDTIEGQPAQTGKQDADAGKRASDEASE
jgi:RNase adapter protein RapZ